MAALNESLVQQKVKVEARSHPDSIYAGAIGAAIWGAFRHGRFQTRETATTGTFGQSQLNGFAAP
jgi:benzoyl-CoA reductase subunit D